MNNLIKSILTMLLLILGVSQTFAEQKVTFYHYDLLGSPVATTDENGAVTWREEYSPWGEKLLKEDEVHDNVRGYTGHVNDKETGLTYMQARYYDPQIGRFMGVDPVGFQENNSISFNRYGYANNNPYKFTDPNGEYPSEVDMDNGEENPRDIVGPEEDGVTHEAWKEDYNSVYAQRERFIKEKGVIQSTIIAAGMTRKGFAKRANMIAKALSSPTVGGGATLGKLSAGEVARIQNAANRSRKNIGVVGSRVNPNKALHSNSDYDYVVKGNHKTRNNLAKSLPGSKSVKNGLPNNQDIFKGSIDVTKPHVIFHPR